MTKIQVRLVALAILASSSTFTLQNRSAQALEAYSPAEEQQFMDWCTATKSAKESTCSCTVKRLAQTIPATALAQFLSTQGSFTLSSAAVTTGAAVTQAFLNCSNS